MPHVKRLGNAMLKCWETPTFKEVGICHLVKR